MLATPDGAPNSPQWFNTGLHWAYGIDGPGQGHHYVDYKTGKLTKSSNRLRAPTAACLLHPVGGRRSGQRGGIMDLWVREARLFKYGSGTGTNFSFLRGEGEKLSGGGKSSGLMGFLKIGDRAAGAIKSGGTTRRAAKMVIVDIDHPDIEDFIDWKVVEEQKVASLVAGSKAHEKHLNGIFDAIQNWDGPLDDCGRPGQERDAEAAIRPPKGVRCRRPTSSACSSTRAGLHRRSSSRPTTPTGIREAYSDGLRPELQQLHPRDRRLPARRSRTTRDWDLINRKDGTVAKT
jgi:ribonucleoside-diphosphate reductase alpha chain